MTRRPTGARFAIVTVMLGLGQAGPAIEQSDVDEACAEAGEGNRSIGSDDKPSPTP